MLTSLQINISKLIMVKKNYVNKLHYYYKYYLSQNKKLVKTVFNDKY